MDNIEFGLHRSKYSQVVTVLSGCSSGTWCDFDLVVIYFFLHTMVTPKANFSTPLAHLPNTMLNNIDSSSTYHVYKVCFKVKCQGRMDYCYDNGVCLSVWDRYMMCVEVEQECLGQDFDWYHFRPHRLVHPNSPTRVELGDTIWHWNYGQTWQIEHILVLAGITKSWTSSRFSTTLISATVTQSRAYWKEMGVKTCHSPTTFGGHGTTFTFTF